MRIYIYNETASVKTDNILRLEALFLKFVDAIWIFLKGICIFVPRFTLGISESPLVMVHVLSSKTGRQMAFFICISSVQSLRRVRLFMTPWTAACQASLSITNSNSNSCPSSQWCHPTTSSSVVPFSSHLQSFPASGSFPMSRFFASGGQSI